MTYKLSKYRDINTWPRLRGLRRIKLARYNKNKLSIILIFCYRSVIHVLNGYLNKLQAKQNQFGVLRDALLGTFNIKKDLYQQNTLTMLARSISFNNFPQ